MPKYLPHEPVVDCVYFWTSPTGLKAYTKLGPDQIVSSYDLIIDKHLCSAFQKPGIEYFNPSSQTFFYKYERLRSQMHLNGLAMASYNTHTLFL